MSGSSELRYGTETPAEGSQCDREVSLNGVEARIFQNPYLLSLANGDIHLSRIGQQIRDTRRDIRQGNEAQNKNLAYVQAESLRVGTTVASTGRSRNVTTTIGKPDVGNQETTIEGQLEVCAFIS